ncbi:hypothetical protein FFE93_013800 [Yersinia sp. KBS0713]|nr:hypothetical protein FFE93_013800 [Yersinia sp. KBS0713]
MNTYLMSTEAITSPSSNCAQGQRRRPNLFKNQTQNEVIDKVPVWREQLDRKDAVNPSLEARAAPSLARTLYSSTRPLRSRSRHRVLSAVCQNSFCCGFRGGAVFLFLFRQPVL